MTTNWSKVVAVGVSVMAMVGSLAVRPARAAIVSNTEIPFNVGVFVPCAAPGVEDIIDMSGSIHFVDTVTLDGNGGAHVSRHTNLQNVSGVGETTGLRYRAEWNNSFEANYKVGEVTTSVFRFNFIGLGKAGTFSVINVQHVTVNANGTVTVAFDKAKVECK